MIRRPFRQMPARVPPSQSARERVLANWRGIDLSSLEKDRNSRAKSSGSVLPTVLKDLGLERRLAERAILKVWHDLIDPDIIAHAHPTGLRKGTLFVAVDNSVWLDEIVRYRRREILERLQHSFGRDLIQRISFRIG
jgi:predicted nucleic acid-binding Zn ribbon protein